MPPAAAAISDCAILETLQKRLDEFEKSKGICIDENTHRRLEELSSQMAGVYGVVESVLQLALSNHGEARTALIETALRISSRATRAIKQFLCEWNVLLEEANRLRLLEKDGVASEEP